MIRTLLLLSLATSFSALAAEKCIDPDPKLLAERDAAVSSALEQALAKKGWRRVQLQELGFASNGVSPGESEKKRTFERKYPDGGVYERYFVVGALDAYFARRATFVKDGKGRVFDVQVSTEIVPTRVVTFCGCEPVWYGGAPPPSYLYGVKLDEGEQLTAVADPRQRQVPSVTVSAKTVKINYAQNDCPPPP